MFILRRYTAAVIDALVLGAAAVIVIASAWSLGSGVALSWFYLPFAAIVFCFAFLDALFPALAPALLLLCCFECVRTGFQFSPAPGVVSPLVASAGAAALLLINWVYHAGLESSPKKGTLGKLALGLNVYTAQDQKLTFKQASARHFAKILSCLLFFLGFFMSLRNKRHLALHDKLTGCLVAQTDEK